MKYLDSSLFLLQLNKIYPPKYGETWFSGCKPVKMFQVFKNFYVRMNNEVARSLFAHQGYAKEHDQNRKKVMDVFFTGRFLRFFCLTLFRTIALVVPSIYFGRKTIFRMLLFQQIPLLSLFIKFHFQHLVFHLKQSIFQIKCVFFDSLL